MRSAQLQNGSPCCSTLPHAAQASRCRRAFAALDSFPAVPRWQLQMTRAHARRFSRHGSMCASSSASASRSTPTASSTSSCATTCCTRC
eukprot:621383-Pleurochrysis_carterae.AAC.1